MSFKPQQKKQSTGGDIDFDYIADQVEDGLEKARVQGIIDLGVHPQPISINDKDFMFLEDTDALLELLAVIREQQGDKLIEEKELDDYEEVEEGYVLQFKVVNDKYVFCGSEDDYSYFDTLEEAEEVLEKAQSLTKAWKWVEKADKTEIIKMEDCLKVNYRTFVPDNNQEFTLVFDLVDTEVEYTEGSGEYKQYRLYFNNPFKGNLRGVGAPAPNKTYSPNSAIVKVIKATGKVDILDENSKDYNDVGLLLNEPLYINIEKNGSFIKAASYGKPKAKELKDFPELQEETVCLTFENATVAMLEALRPRKAYIDKIKAALNYEGSAIQKAIEEWEAGKSSPAKDEDDESEEKEAVKKPSKKTSKAADEPEEKTTSKPTKKKVVKKEEPEPEDEEDDDEPW